MPERVSPRLVLLTVGLGLAAVGAAGVLGVSGIRPLLGVSLLVGVAVVAFFVQAQYAQLRRN